MNYVCENHLRTQLLFEENTNTKQILIDLLSPLAEIDFAEIDGLTPHVRRKIAVPERCSDDCPHREFCRYLRFRKEAQTPEIDIQICNHNYLFADTIRRAMGESPLIPNYQILVIDEAHKLLTAAQMMYGSELSDLSFTQVQNDIVKLNFVCPSAQRAALTITKKFTETGKRIFKTLLSQRKGGQSDRFAVSLDAENTRRLRSLSKIADAFIYFLNTERLKRFGAERKTKICWELEQIRNQAAAFAKRDRLICWLETDKNENRLCAVPKDLGNRLFTNQWSKGVPTILTSGTLSAEKDFTHTKRTLGLNVPGIRLTETSKPLPFNHRENVILYISENVPFPEQRNKGYISIVADEIERLVIASHGHAAVLFTSYRVMDMVWEQLTKRSLPFPMFRLDKGGVREIERFKQSGNGIVFAAGALWEGIDIPGDPLSMLIIVKLPFAVPDPISEYERSLYSDFRVYRDTVIVPEMLIKLKQGFGRLIRTESDSGCAAILDSRANSGGNYRSRVIAALPDCRVTCDISEIARFFREKKSSEYFK